MAKCIFDFVAGGQLLVYKGGDPKGGGAIFLRFWQFFIKCTPPDIKF